MALACNSAYGIAGQLLWDHDSVKTKILLSNRGQRQSLQTENLS